jgi:hypothetical protein
MLSISLPKEIRACLGFFVASLKEVEAIISFGFFELRSRVSRKSGDLDPQEATRIHAEAGKRLALMLVVVIE